MKRLQTQFYLKMLHEIKFSLREILSSSEEAEPSQDASEKVNHLTNRLLNRIKDITDFMRDEGSPIDLDIQPVQLFQLVEDILQNFTPLSRDIQLNNEVDPTFQAILTDPIRLKQVFYNLIDNAIKYTRKGSVTISMTQQLGSISILIQDTGIGLSHTERDRLLNHDEPTEEGLHRSGIGLSIAKKMVESLHGTIHVESSLGLGSCFTITLPLNYSDTKLLEQANSLDQIDLLAEEKKSLLKRSTVLLLDDDPITLRLLKAYLEQYYEVIACTNPYDALDIVIAKKADIMLLDLVMPDLSGYEVILQVRKHLPRTEFPILIATVRENALEVIKGLELGANDYLLKPLHPMELKSRIDIHLESKELTLSLEDEIHGLRQEVEDNTCLNITLMERHQHKLIDQSFEDITIMFNENMIIQSISKTVTYVFGIQESELIGMPLETFLQDQIDLSSFEQSESGFQVDFVTFCKDRQDVAIGLLGEFIVNPQEGGSIHFHLARQLEVTMPLRIKKYRVLYVSKLILPRAVEQLPESAPIVEAQEPAVVSSQEPAMEAASPQTEDGLRQLLVEVMNLSLNYWYVTTQKSKIDLAEESQLWHVSVDGKGTARTRTLDRYLTVRNFPHKPRYQNLLQTALFVLQHTPNSAPDLRVELSHKADDLKLYLQAVLS